MKSIPITRKTESVSNNLPNPHHSNKASAIFFCFVFFLGNLGNQTGAIIRVPFEMRYRSRKVSRGGVVDDDGW